MTDNPLIVDKSLFSPKMIHQSTRDCVLSCNLMSKLGKRCSFRDNVGRIIILRGKSLLFQQKKIKRNAYLPTQILNLKKWEPRYLFIMASDYFGSLFG